MGLMWVGLGALSNMKPDQLQAGKQLLVMDVMVHLCIRDWHLSSPPPSNTVSLTYSKRQAFVERMNQQAAKACAFPKHGSPGVDDRALRTSRENEQATQERGQKAE